MIENVKNVLMMTTIPRYSIEELEYLTPKGHDAIQPKFLLPVIKLKF